MYYFNIFYGVECVLDTEGTDLSDIKGAHKEAVAIAEELKGELPGFFQEGSFVDVVADGQSILTVPIVASEQAGA